MQILGLYIDPPFFHTVLTRKKGGKTILLQQKSFLLEEISHVKRFYNFSSKVQIRSAIRTQNLLVKRIQIEIGSSRHLKEVLAFQADAESNFEPEEMLSIPWALQKTGKKQDALLFHLPKKEMMTHVDLCLKQELPSDFVTASPIALLQYAKWKLGAFTNGFLVDLGSAEWCCACVANGELTKCYAIPVAGLFSKNFLSNPLFAQKTQELAKVLYSFFYSMGKQPLLLTGRTDLCQKLESQFLEWTLPIDTKNMEDREFAIPIGLTTKKTHELPSFLLSEFFPAKIWRKGGIYALGLMFASLLVSLAILGLSFTALKSKSLEISSQLYQFLARKDKGLIEMVFADSEIESILHRWNRAIITHSKDAPYIPNTPKVSEILHWFYEHPLIVSLTQGEDPIDIEEMEYRLLQYPRINAPQEPYSAKMQIRFTTKNALHARKLHDFLLQGEGLIDGSKEIEWEVVNQAYVASFFIKEAK